MNEKMSMPHMDDLPLFDRRFFESDEVMSRIGEGAIGGKATGLAFAHQVIKDSFSEGNHEGLLVSIPRFVVLGTDVFDAFMSRNNLYDIVLEDMPDDRIANAFQRADFPAEFSGDLRALIASVHSPLAIRSSSMLEDAMYEPFAGVYWTKMTPNNQPDTDTRYAKLIEGVKLVFASTFFHEAKAYMQMTSNSSAVEKMAVIIQEIVGLRFGDRFYPPLSGVARSYNYYTFGHAQPEDGIVDLALGLGKTIVDGGLVWTYCPAFPKISPPFTTSEMMKYTQTEFWSVNMGKPPDFDPITEAEYMIKCGLKDAEYDNTIHSLASTYQPRDDRLVLGTGRDGPRVLNFAPILQMGEIPLNSLIQKLLTECSNRLETAVEMEFALELDPLDKQPSRFGLVQVRPMVVSDAKVDVKEEELNSERAIIATRKALGNGLTDDLVNIVFVRPDDFKKEETKKIAMEIDAINKQIVAEGERYVLIGFGRWGSSDPWLGIPVDWGNISGVQVLVEATLPDMNVELSQGSHFFHNLSSLQLLYFNVQHTGSFEIDWGWLGKQHVISRSNFISHVRLENPLTIKVDGRSGWGVILK